MTRVPDTNLDPNESDPDVLWTEIARLQAAVAGPSGFASWQSAAVAERMGRVAAQRENADLKDRLARSRIDITRELREQGWTPPAGAPSIDAAREMGAKGGPAVEAERLAFEAWMAGHCWALCARWTGTAYLDDDETTGYVSMQAMVTRRLWAAWRDRAALATQPAAGGPTAEVML